MGIAALIAWLVAALGGFVMLGIWVARGGRRPDGTRLAPGLMFGHFALAAIGLVIWIVYLITETDALAWIAVGLLVIVALLGFTMFGRWLSSRRTAVAEAKFPVPIVLVHGLLGATTLVLSLLTALGVG